MRSRSGLTHGRPVEIHFAIVSDADDPQSLSRSAVAAWAQKQQQAREAALTAEQRIALAVILGRRARALRAPAKP